MGKGPDDITGEIEGLRQQSDIIVDELLRRATLPNVAHGVTAAVAERASLAVNEASAVVSEAASTVSRMADEMPEPVREHPFAATYAGGGRWPGLRGSPCRGSRLRDGPRPLRGLLTGCGSLPPGRARS